MNESLSTETEMQPLRPVIIQIKINPKRPGWPAYPGWLVPETSDFLAVDQRTEADLESMSPASWVITHLPSGHRVGNGLYTEATSRHDAIALAQRFYKAAQEIGVNLASSDPAEVVAPFQKLSVEQKRALWEQIAGWEEKKTTQETIDAG